MDEYFSAWFPLPSFVGLTHRANNFVRECICQAGKKTKSCIYSLKINLIDKNGPVKLIKRVKIAHLSLQSVSDQFHIVILSLPM